MTSHAMTGFSNSPAVPADAADARRIPGSPSRALLGVVNALALSSAVYAVALGVWWVL